MKLATKHDCKQRSDEWFSLRKGLLTASEAGAWLTKSDKRSIEAQRKMICKKLAEYNNCEAAPTFESWAMTRGTELEPEAVESFAKEMKVEVEEVGFMRSNEFQAGCSPDGLIKHSALGFEGKCPIPETHIGYILQPELLLEAYKWQIELSLAVTGAEGWHLQSYCPELPPVRLFIEPSETTEAITEGLGTFTDLFFESVKEVENAREKAYF